MEEIDLKEDIQRALGHTTTLRAGETADRLGLPTAYAAKVMSQLAR